MLQRIFLVIFCTLVGFAGATGAYLLITNQRPQIISPLSPTLFSLLKAPTQSIVGSISSLSGDVLWQSRLPDTQPILITQPQQIQQGEDLSTGSKAKATLNFSNVGNIYLLANTHLSVVQALAESVVIQEIQGSAVFDKQSSQIPLSVRALDLLISINGQSLVTVDKENQTVRIEVKTESSTLAFTDTENTSQVVQLTNGQSLLFDNNTKKASMQ